MTSNQESLCFASRCRFAPRFSVGGGWLVANYHPNSTQHNLQSQQVRFKKVSEEAKKFCSSLIAVDPKVRLNAEEALAHPWITTLHNLEDRRPDSGVMEGVTDSLKKFGGYGNFQKMALMVIAHQSSTDEIFELRKAFDQYDNHNNGMITYNEFKEALKKVHAEQSEDEMKVSEEQAKRTGQARHEEYTRSEPSRRDTRSEATRRFISRGAKRRAVTYHEEHTRSEATRRFISRGAKRRGVS